MSINGAKHYGFDVNKEKIKIIKTNKPISFPYNLIVRKKEVLIFQPEFPVFWEVKASK